MCRKCTAPTGCPTLKVVAYARLIDSSLPHRSRVYLFGAKAAMPIHTIKQ